MQQLRITHLVRSLDIGGLERVVLDLVRHRTAETFDVRVVCLQHRGELADRFEEIGVPVVALDLANVSFWGRLKALRRELCESRPEVLHTHNSGPHVNGAFAAQLSGVPVLIHTKHGRNYVNDRKKLRQNRIASLMSTKIVCVSRDAAEVALHKEKVSPRRVQVVHNGIDIGRFWVNPVPCSSPEHIRAIHVARLNPVKDQATLLRAVRRVVDTYPKFQLDIIGDGPIREEIQRISAELNLQPHVRFHGMRDDVPDLLAAADMFLLSSVSEGISLTLLEAMAAGLPVVATDVGGNCEVVEAGSTGLLVPARDPAAFADAVLQLCRVPQQAQEMGRQGRERVERHFSVTSMVAAYEQLYCQLLGRPERYRSQPKVATESSPEPMTSTRA